MDFLEYFEMGGFDEYFEEVEIDDTQKPKKSKETQSIDEGLIEVLFKTLRTNLKVNVAGMLIYFRWEWMNNKTFFTNRMKKSTFAAMMKWLRDIEKGVFPEETEEEEK